MRINKWIDLGMGKKSRLATDEPWRHPARDSQYPDNEHPIENAAEQEARAQKSQWDKAVPKAQ